MNLPTYHQFFTLRSAAAGATLAPDSLHLANLSHANSILECCARGWLTPKDPRGGEIYYLTDDGKAALSAYLAAQDKFLCPSAWAPGVLADWQIRSLADRGMITEGYVPKLQSADEDGNRIISYGVSSYGYDARIAPEFMVISKQASRDGVEFDPATELVSSRLRPIDPKHPSDVHFEEVKADKFTVPPNSFVLTRTIEYFKIPDDVLVNCIGKSTYARVGCVAIVTPLEPGWEGHVTLEFSNTTPLPMVIHANEGGVQFVFSKGSSPCDTTYRDRDGKYQGQRGITTARV